MKIVRLLLILALAAIISEAAAEADKKGRSRKCSLKDGVETCAKSEEKLSRKKRVVSLPNQTSLTMQSRLFVPQPPVGLYLIWIRVRFFVRPMFTESTIT